MTTSTRTLNAEQTSRLARRYEGALALLSNPNYTFTPFTTNPEAFYVEKEDGTIYTVSVTNCYCTCPDFVRHQDFCKHVLAAEVDFAKRHDCLCRQLLQTRARCGGVADAERADGGVRSERGGRAGRIPALTK